MPPRGYVAQNKYHSVSVFLGASAKQVDGEVGHHTEPNGGAHGDEEKAQDGVHLLLELLHLRWNGKDEVQERRDDTAIEKAGHGDGLPQALCLGRSVHCHWYKLDGA